MTDKYLDKQEQTGPYRAEQEKVKSQETIPWMTIKVKWFKRRKPFELGVKSAARPLTQRENTSHSRSLLNLPIWETWSAFPRCMTYDLQGYIDWRSFPNFDLHLLHSLTFGSCLAFTNISMIQMFYLYSDTYINAS